MERYEKIRVIGQGAFGKVFLCRRKVDSSLLVIKQIPVDEMGIEERKAALNEVDVLSILKHPNIVAYFDNFFNEKSMMIVMEYAPGGTLFDFIQERNGTLMEEEHILQFFVQIVVAIHYVHSLKILHRDLKTQNIMLNKKRTVVKIGDFGISKVLSSKITSAKTVVGTPCYISPEICEGKLYAKKSDVWAMGCILYELTTLKKAFEGPNLPALVMKIMQAARALIPISSRYSSGLKELINATLQRSPEQRLQVEEIMAQPLLVNPLLNLGTDVGRMPCSTRKSSVSYSGRREDLQAQGPKRMGSLKGFRKRSFFEDDYIPAQMSGTSTGSRSQIMFWGGGTSTPVTLPPFQDSRVTSVAVGRSQRAGVTEDGKVIFWELSSGSLATTRLTMQRTKHSARAPLVFVPRLISGFSTSVIKKVSCGDMFTACLTENGILMTFGNGATGCLGHGDYSDASEPRLVHFMLTFETIDVACGSNHVMAITADGDVYSWGKGDSGQLGVGSHKSYPSPQQVTVFPSNSDLMGKPKSVACGTDCSLIVTASGAVMATGSNRYNKLALDSSATDVDAPPPSAAASAGTGSEVNVNGSLGLATPSKEKEEHRPAVVQSVMPTAEPPATNAPVNKPNSILRATASQNLMNSSFILSSAVHKKKMTSLVSAAAAIGTLSSANNNCSSSSAQECTGVSKAVLSGSGAAQNPHMRVVDETITFHMCGSPILKDGSVVTTVAVGTNHTALVTDAGELFTCGANTYGQLGCRRGEEGERDLVQVRLPNREDWTVEKVSCGDSFTVASTTDGRVYSWGRGQRGRLGRETSEDSYEPREVIIEDPQTVQSLSCSHAITLLVTIPKL